MTFFNESSALFDAPTFCSSSYNEPIMETPDIVELLQPETELERRMLQDTSFQKGLHWGVPRFGHPEGKVLLHVRDVLNNIDKIPNLFKEDRERLRAIAFAHDTFKYIEHKGSPRDWNRHHAMYARKFLEHYTDDSIILDITELHDEAYYSWRTLALSNKPEQGRERLQHLLNRVGDNLQLYYYFFKCDTQTGDKNPAPLKWFEKNIAGIEVVDF